ncbi:MAG: hypothetical protein ABW032_08730 [Burkholderiaceae bacterium]
MLFVASVMDCRPAAARDAHAASPPHPATAAPAAADLMPAAHAFSPPPPSDERIYRCGDSYSPRPCGATPPIDVRDPRTALQHRQAEDVAARDRRLAAWLEAERREREAPPPRVPEKARPQTSRACVPAPPAACPIQPSRRRIAKPSGRASAATTFRAVK